MPEDLPDIPDRLWWNDPFPGMRCLAIHLDGKRVLGVRAYCISEGWVQAYRYGDDGQPVMGGDDLVVDQLRGEVTVEYDHAPACDHRPAVQH